jgi:hypothetical protein
MNYQYRSLSTCGLGLQYSRYFVDCICDGSQDQFVNLSDTLANNTPSHNDYSRLLPPIAVNGGGDRR